MYGMVFKHLYSAPQQPWANRSALVRLDPRKEKRDKEVERLNDKKEARLLVRSKSVLQAQ